MNLHGLSDSVAGVSESPAKCRQCGATTRLGNGLCLSCTLREGLEGDSEASRESFEAILAEDEVRDTRWRVGNYEILEEIGRGGMGVIYRARQRHSRRIVALKRMVSYHADSRETLERFRREAEAAASLDHPNILPIYEVGQGEDGLPFFSMKYAAGGSLQKAEPALRSELRECVRLMAKVARAVQYAHEHGLLHRDLKPGNILLDGRGEPFVTDFGLAKWLDTSTDLTRTLAIFGTPGYIAPEQAKGPAANLTPAADVYSLGAILFDLFTGRPPFLGEHALAVIQQASEKPAPKLRSLAPAFDRDLETICARCLEREPQARYRSAGDLAIDLERWLEGRPIIARRVSPPMRVWRWSKRNPKLAAATAAAVCSAMAAAFLLFSHNGLPPQSRLDSRLSATSSISEKSVAVLPFENLSRDPDNAYFAEGIQDEILTKLAAVRDLKVISRTSTAKYQSKPDNLKKVAQELGVSTILEGAVQKAGDKVRVNVQLIDARSDTHLWAKSYDRDLKDVLKVESEVSREIAEALQANLSPSESHVLMAAQTQDAEAYDLFLRGEYEFYQAEISPTAEAYDRADAFYRQALARDPNFAEAAAGFAYCRLSRHWNVSPLAPAELEEVKSLIDRAVALAPNSPEAHLALGLFFYWGHRQYEMALAEFNRTLELQPNNALARQYCAWVYRRRGEWERSLADSQRAQELDPRDAGIPSNIGETYLALRLWKDAERAELRALAINPHHAAAALALLCSRLNSTGDVDSARRALDGFPEAIKSVNLIRRGGSVFGDVGAITGNWVYLDVIKRRFTDAFQEFEKGVVNDYRAHLQQLAGRAALRVLAGQTEAAKSAGEEAVPLLEARFRERPDDIFVVTELSWVYLALGRNDDALRLSRQAVDTISIEKDAVTGPYFQNGLAQIEARAGASVEAIKRLRHLLSIPAGWDVSIARLKIDPVWDPIRNRPDFQQLLSGPEQIGPNK
ncbi:MAG: protein kinase domain-containing protein [Chthoniobacterales bacterium]